MFSYRIQQSSRVCCHIRLLQWQEDNFVLFTSFSEKNICIFLLFSLFVSKAYGGAGGAALLINNPPSVCTLYIFFFFLAFFKCLVACCHSFFYFTLISYILWRSSLNIYLCVVVFYCGASKTRNLSLQVEEIHQSFCVINAPKIFRDKSVVL